MTAPSPTGPAPPPPVSHQPAAAPPRRRPGLRLALVAAALLLAALTFADRRAERRERAELDRRLAGLELPEAAARALPAVAREDDAAHRRLAIARAVVGIESRTLREGEAAAAAERRLDAAAALAAEALAARPAAWEASLLLGAATYLARRRAGDPRVVTEAAAWEAPLARARDLAPTSAEAARFAAVAYLDLWPALSAEKRRLTGELLAAAFRDDRARSALLEAWIDAVDDPDEAMALLPGDRPGAWRQAEEAFAARGDWASAAEARRRSQPALAADLARRLDAAAAVGRRDPAAARQAALAAIAEAPPEESFLPLVARALDEAPPGAVPPGGAPGARAWLDWSLDLGLAGHETLSPRQVDRLAGLAGELPPPLAARAALAAGRDDLLRRLERDAGAAAEGAAWGAYRLARARRHAEDGETRAALEALARVGGPWRQSPLHDALALRLAATIGDDEAARAARRRLAAAGAAEPLPTAGEAAARFALFASAPAGRIVLEIGERQAPALLEVHVDGRLFDVVRVRPGRRAVARGELAAGLHVVDVAARGERPRLERVAVAP